MKHKNVFSLLHPRIVEVLKKFGYRKPTPIQEKVIPKILKNPKSNYLITAPTGYGKTEAVILPILHMIYSDDLNNINKVNKDGIIVLYITPLRALNRDIFYRLFPMISKELGIEIEVRHGDTEASVRAKQARKPPKILVTTPETLQSILLGSKIREHLRSVKWVIVDEVHAILDSKRGVQLSIGLERLREISKDFSIIGLSATIGNAKEVLEFLTNGRGGEIISLREAKKIYNIIIDAVEPIADITVGSDRNYRIDLIGIVKKIIYWVNNTRGKVIVFTNTRDMAEILGLYLKKFGDFSVDVHHSSLSKEVRLNVERRFKLGELKCVIATASLELGIDIGEAELVIQVMSPRRVETALQRIGRAGHFLNRVSKGVIIAATYDDLYESLAIARLIEDGYVEPIQFLGNNYDVLAHQIIGIVREKYLEGKKGVDIKYVFNLIKRSLMYKSISFNEFLEVIDFMEKNCRLIRLENNKIFLRKNSIRFYFENISTIPSTTKYRVLDISENKKKVGELDSKYVLELERGKVFLLAGVPREVLDIDTKKREVVVISTSLEGKPPAWTGELLPVSKRVANMVGEIRKIFIDHRLLDEFDKYLTEDAKKILRKTLTFYEKDKKIPNENTIVVEFDKDSGIMVIHSVYGSKINRTLATILAKKFLENINTPFIGFDSDPYRIILKFYRGFLSPENLFDQLEEILNMVIDLSFKEKEFEEFLFEAVKEFDINELTWYFLNVLKRFGLVSNDADLSKKQILKLMSKYSGKVVLKEAVREFIQTKMDVGGVIELLKKIDNGEVSIIFTEGLSKLGMQLNTLMNFIIKDMKEIIEKKYEERLLNREIRFICLNCGYSKIDKVANYFTSCPKCKSKLVSATKRWDEEVVELVKRRRSSHLTKDEVEKIKNLQIICRYLNAYGHLALLPLAASGIGLKQAISILKNSIGSKKLLLESIRKKEINYIKSKSFIEYK